MRLVVGALVTFLTFNLLAQTPGENISVQIQASAQSGMISLSWLNDGSATNYAVYRKIPPSTTWGSSIATLSGSANSYVDNTITDGINHEYKIVKTGGTTAYGYINAAFEKLEVIHRGILILVVEDTYQGNPTFEAAIQMTIEDIENDGWIVKRLDVNQNDAVTLVKSGIVALYNQNTADTKAVYLIGHVPVPYSGLMNPDGHPEHLGAWPADVYYGEMNGTWTDANVNDVTADFTRNHNIPGDGKFDQGLVASVIELQVGRVDFANLGAFSDTEETLLIRYLNKAHMYKAKGFTAQERALIDDNFTPYAEGFSSSGYRNFSTMFTSANVTNSLDLRTTTATDSYMWSYGCGAGWFTSCDGIGTTNDLAGDSLQTVFTMQFGSYFGDWDSDDNFLRAFIAQGQTLNAMWAGRPQWSVQHMSLGETIGFSSLLTQNNQSNTGYYGSTTAYFDKWVHIALMGDPTMRMHYLIPPSSLVVVSNNNVADLSWTASPDANVGYNVYRLIPSVGYYEKVNASIVTGTSFSDNSIPTGGDITYVVKAVDLKITASGSYFNQSLGIRDNAVFTVGLDEEMNSTISVYPNPVEDELQIIGGEIKEYVIFNLQGKVVQRGGGSHQISFSSLEEGSYYLLLTENNGARTRFRLVH